MTRDEQDAVILRAREAGYFGDLHDRWNAGWYLAAPYTEPTPGDCELCLSVVRDCEELIGERALDRFRAFEMALTGFPATWIAKFKAALVYYLEDHP